LRALSPDDRAAIEEALSYPEETAGRLMQRDLIAVPEHWTVGQVIDFLRDNQELTTDFWEIFVVDPAHKPIGTAQLSWILRTPRSVGMADVMKREQTLIPVEMDQEEVALRFQKYGLISAAVTDPSGRLVGMITVDDIVHIIQEEASEDILKLSGAGEGDINEPIVETYKARVRWLLVNLLTALLAASIIRAFEGTIEQMAVARRLDAHGGWGRRQCRDANHGGRRSCDCDQSADRSQYIAHHRPGDPGRAAQWRDRRHCDRGGGNACAGQFTARRSHRLCHAGQHHDRRHGRGAGARPSGPDGC
jgi:CBS domain-containing protein